MSFMDPRSKLKQISDISERRIIKGLMDIIENDYGFNFSTEMGSVIEVQMISTGLASIPRNLIFLPKLYKLQLQTNKIKKLRMIERFKNLTILNLSDNKLTSAGLSLLTQISTLKSINLAYNEIDSLKNFENLRGLESLNLSNNDISEIPPLPNLSNLKFLDLSGNPIKKLENIQYLEKLISIKCENTLIPADQLEILAQGIESIKEFCRNTEKKQKNK